LARRNETPGWTTTSDLIAVRRLLVEPDNPEVSGPAPEQATACPQTSHDVDAVAAAERDRCRDRGSHDDRAGSETRADAGAGLALGMARDSHIATSAHQCLLPICKRWAPNERPAPCSTSLLADGSSCPGRPNQVPALPLNQPCGEMTASAMG
jgi:hypothetical protein